MPHISYSLHLARRPVAIIWAIAIIASVISLCMLRLPTLSPAALIGAAVLVPLLVLGDSAAVELEDEFIVSLVPALLIGALYIAGWAALLVSILVSAVILASIHRRTIRQALRDAGTRWISVAIIAPIYLLTVQPALVPFRTPQALVGLLFFGAIAYLIEFVAQSKTYDRGAARSEWRSWVGPLCWYLLTMLSLGAILGILWTISPWACALGLIPIAIVQQSFRNQVALRQAKAENVRLTHQREALATDFERFQALATTMIGTLNPQTMLGQLCERLAGLVNASHGWVVLCEGGDQPELMTVYNLAAPDDQQQTFIDAESYTELLKQESVMLLTDERRIELAPVVAWRESMRWSAVLSIPLVTDQQVLGAVCLAFEHPRELDVDEQRVLNSFAKQAATMVEQARVFSDLHQKQMELIQSSKLTAVGTFAAGIAHEFNNLLASMLGYAQLGVRSKNVIDKDDALDVILQACMRGSNIIRGLLTFARQQGHNCVLADITDAVNDTLMLLTPNLDQANIMVVKRFEPVPPIVCDPGQIAQVVLNFVTNARDAMQPDGGTLTIGLRERRGVIELSVTDTGCGIADKIRDKIFDPFVTTKGALGGSHTPGTGLGLSVVYGIVQNHGGEITVRSKVGQGTTITACLPVAMERGVGERVIRSGHSIASMVE